MKQPAEIANDTEAIKFWRRHNKALCEANYLTDADRDSFILLCRTWSLLQQLKENLGEAKIWRVYVDMQRQYTSLANKFGLFPDARAKNKVPIKPNQQEPDDEFNDL